MIDLDNDDCKRLKKSLEEIAHSIGFTTKSRSSKDNSFQVLNRIAIEELEAWFFGDITAVKSVYPRIDANLGSKAKYRNPDSILGGTWEALERELQKLGYYPGGLAKITAAREISTYMIPERNKSKSFQVFRQGLLSLV